MDTRVVALDSDFINGMYYASQRGVPDAFNSVFGDGRKVVITSTVIDELTSNPAGFPKDAAVESWINSEEASGNLTVIPTPGYPAGIKDNGEKSILSEIPTMHEMGSGGSVQVLTNDRSAREI